MARTIYKYTLEIADDQEITMPRGAEILCVHEQDHRVCIWAEVVTDRHPQQRRFIVRGTGYSIDPNLDKKYIGTVFLSNGLVFHVFEVR